MKNKSSNKDKRVQVARATRRLSANPSRVGRKLLPHRNGMGHNIWRQFTSDITTDASKNSVILFTDQTTTATTPSIVNNFAKIRFLTFAIEWLPAVGPASADASSYVYLATYAGGEIMKTVAAKNFVNTIADIKTSNTLRSWNAWEHVTVNVPMSGKWIDTNATFNFAGATAEEYARSMTFLSAAGFESITASTKLGKFLLHTTYEVGGQLTGTVDT